jgi:polysaccharide export outer membrane protein
MALAGSSPATAQEGPAFRVGPGDELTIQVYEDDTLNVARRVGSDGSITLPLVGKISVGDRTVEEIGRILQATLERTYLQRATIDVEISEYRSRPVSVIGAVRSPGTVYMDGSWSLFQVIAAAGGLASESGGAVILRRSADGRLVDQLEVDLEAVFERGDRVQNVAVYANDVINVQGLAEITVYFLGEVASKGAVTLKGSDTATLLTAVARAGGLTDRASNKVLIKRDQGGDQRREIVANFQRILAGSDPDIELLDGDLIVVKESFL